MFGENDDRCEGWFYWGFLQTKILNTLGSFYLIFFSLLSINFNRVVNYGNICRHFYSAYFGSNNLSRNYQRLIHASLDKSTE